MELRTLPVEWTTVLVLPALADKPHPNPAGIVPAAIGDIDVIHDNNGNTRLDLKADHLAAPTGLNLSKTVYVAWARSITEPAGPVAPQANTGQSQ